MGNHTPSPSDSKIGGEIKHTHMKRLKSNKNKNIINSVHITILYLKHLIGYGEEDVKCQQQRVKNVSLKLPATTIYSKKTAQNEDTNFMGQKTYQCYLYTKINSNNPNFD